MLWLPVILLWTICSAAQAVVCGEPISDKDNHWLVNLGQGSKIPQLCSGTLLSPDIVITAWHCVDNNYETITVRLGPGRDSALSGAPVRIMNEDVALVRLKQAIGEPTDAFPQLAATLPESGRIETAGWGLSVIGFKPPEGLSCPAAEKGRPHRAQVSRVDQQLCRRSGEAPQGEASRTVCAHGSSGEGQAPSSKTLRIFNRAGPGACQGDSGGPLLITENRSFPQIIGIQSEVINISGFDTPASCAYNPAIYTSSSIIFQNVTKIIREMGVFISNPLTKEEKRHD